MKQISQNPFFLNLPSHIFIIIVNINKLDCDIQCDLCFGNSNTCISCSNYRVNPPLCYCESETNTYSDISSISKPCENNSCLNKCQTCSKKPENCIQCRGDRVNPPTCNCPQGTYEDPINLNNEFCLKCLSNFYYDLQYNKCIQCNKFCNTCYGPNINNCLSCHSIYKLNSQNQCYCSEGSSPIVDQYNKNQCFQNMDIIQNIYIKNNNYFILIQFEYEIDFIESLIQKFGINLVFSFSIGQINPNYYSIASYSFPKNDQVILNIEIKKNIQRTFGQLIFLKSSIFQNYKNQVVLNPIYLIKPFQFEIGPYFTETKLQIDIKLTSTLNQQSIDFMRNIQFLFYLINSAQPTVMILLVDIQIPPNFYNFLSEIGKMVFRNVSEYSQIHFQNFYTFAGQNITSYVKPTNIYQFDRVGISNSYLANAEFIFYKYLICLFFFAFFKVAQVYNFNERYSQAMKKFFMGRILAETEINFLMNFISIMISFINIDQENYVSRQSLYASIFLLVVIFSFWFCYYKEYNSNSLNQEKDYFNILDGKLDKNKMNSSWSVKNFYFIGLFKKVILILVIFCFYKNSISICYIFTIINLISGIYTLYLRPHDYIFRNILKALADIVLSVVWIFMILFNEEFKNLQGEIVMDDDQVDSIITKGFIASLMTLIYNLIFFFIFLIEIVILLQKFINKQGISLRVRMKKSQKSENQQSILIGHQFQNKDNQKINCL